MLLGYPTMGGCPVPDELNRAVVLGYPEFCIVESDVTVSLVPYLTHTIQHPKEKISQAIFSTKNPFMEHENKVYVKHLNWFLL